MFNAVEANDYLIRLKFRSDERHRVGKTTIADEDDGSAYPERREKYSTHRFLEQDPTIINFKKNTRFRETGKLQCDVCSFDFKDMYGEIGECLVEAHLTIPVAEMHGERNAKVSEIALVCSSCH